MRRLLVNQYSLYRSAIGQFMRLFEASFRLARTDLRAAKIRKRAYRNMIEQVLRKEEIIRELEESSFSQDDIKISFAAAIRYIGNPNCRLHAFFNSVLAHTDDLKRVEVLLMIDSDDDIEYFLRVKRVYGNRFRLCIFVSPQRFGYEKLHIYDKLLFKKIAPKTLMIGDYSDDVIITRKGYDSSLVEIDSDFPDRIYFVHTRHTNRDEFLGDPSKETYRLYWIMQVQGPHSYVPLFSRRVLELMELALETLPEAERANWSPYANTWICDCYIDAISTMLRAKGYERNVELDMMRVHPYNLFAGHQHNRDQYNLSPSDRAIITMLGTETRKHIDTIATVIADAITAESSSSSKEQSREFRYTKKPKLAS